MKPLKKAIQIALDKGQPIQGAIDELLWDYRSTPHPATGLTPGDMLFRGGYRSKFPQQPNPTEHQIEEAKNRDSKRKNTTNAKVNSSRWRKYTDIIQGEKVLLKRQTGQNKYMSIYEQVPYTVTDVQGSRYELVKETDYDNSKKIYRHLNDIKKYHSCPKAKVHVTPSLRRRHHSLDIKTDAPPQPQRTIASTPTTSVPGPISMRSTGGKESGRSQRERRLPKKYDDYLVFLPGNKMCAGKK